MKILYLCCFVAILLFTSCKDKSQIKNVSLPDAVDLISTPIKIDVNLLVPSRIFIKENKLIVFERDDTDMFKVFDFPSFRHLYSFGNRGRGPNEFVHLVTGSDIINTDTEFVEVFEQIKLNYVKFTDTLAYIHSSVPIPRFRQPINRFRKLNDSIYFYLNWLDGDDENQFTRFNLNTGERTYFAPFPDWDKTVTTPEKKFGTYNQIISYDFTHKKILVFYFYFPVFSIFDFDGNAVNEIHIKNAPRTPKTNYGEIHLDNKIFFWSQTLSLENYIFTLWMGGESRGTIDDTFEDIKSEMLVFDWEGNIVGRYRFDRFISNFTVSEKTGKIYGLPYPGDEIIDVIYAYDLPEMVHIH